MTLKKFYSRYWNRIIQHGIIHKIELEKYLSEGKLTRAEYFLQRVVTLCHLTPELTEDEIVTLMTDHFEPIIQDAIRVQNVTTVQDMETSCNKNISWNRTIIHVNETALKTTTTTVNHRTSNDQLAIEPRRQ